MEDKKEIEVYKDVVYDTLLKIEDTLYLLKDGKQILANNKILGIKQKLAVLYEKMKDSIDENVQNE